MSVSSDTDLTMDILNSNSDDEMSDQKEELIMEFIHESAFFQRKLGERTDLFHTIRDDEFIKRYRLSKQTAVFLLEIIHEQLDIGTNKNHRVTPINQLLCALRYYATGSQLTVCGDIIGAHESTACRIVHRVTHAVASLYNRFIKMPNTPAEIEASASKFYEIAKFPRVIGAIDCTHIPILSPGGNNAEIYRNRKGFFSINTQCICAANLTFQDVVARWHGSAHDSNIWDNCAQKRDFVQNKYTDKFLLGDSGYAQTTYMMTPLSNPVSRAEKLYQESHIKTRNTIERTFGIWKRRFPILSKGINMKLHRVPGIVIAMAVLHNICIIQNDALSPEEIQLDEPSGFADDHQNQNSHAGSRAGNLERRLLIDNYFARL